MGKLKVLSDDKTFAVRDSKESRTAFFWKLQALSPKLLLEDF